MKQLIVIGYFVETIELCERAGFEIVGIVDSYEPSSKYTYIGNDEYVLNHQEQFNHIPICLVPDSPKVRRKLYYLYKGKGFEIQTIISPRAFISESAVIGTGSIIQDGCNISSNVIIGKGVRVNTMANIMHDSRINDFTTVAPSTVILGRCNISREVYIGANATILPNICVGEECIVGAGAVVTRDVLDHEVVVGVPAKRLY